MIHRSLSSNRGGNMETLTNSTPLSDLPPASRRWLLLEQYVNRKDDDPSVPDAKTTAASCTSTGQSFSVSFAPAAPPAISTYCCDWIGDAPDGDGNDYDEERRRRCDESKSLHIIAAHDDCALIQMRIPKSRGRSRYYNTCDYFLYEAGAGRTPWLSLLPGCYFSRQFDRDRGSDRSIIPSRSDIPRSFDVSNTAMLRLIDGEVLVAQLEVIYRDGGQQDAAELCVLRPGREWELKPLPIAHHVGGKMPHWLQFNATIAVGVQYVCWVDYNCGFILCDVAEETTTMLLYIPLPIPLPEEHRRDRDRPYLPYCRNLGAAGLDAVRFVSVAPRCCCGGHGKTSCERSRFAFNVTTWTLTLKNEGPMTWVKDGVLDCDELWQLPNYGCLPRVAPEYPMVSADNPNVICFVLCEDRYLIDNADETVWLLEVDTRRKALLSVIRHGTGGYYSDSRLPSKICW